MARIQSSPTEPVDMSRGGPLMEEAPLPKQLSFPSKSSGALTNDCACRLQPRAFFSARFSGCSFALGLLGQQAVSTRKTGVHAQTAAGLIPCRTVQQASAPMVPGGGALAWELRGPRSGKKAPVSTHPQSTSRHWSRPAKCPISDPPLA